MHPLSVGLGNHEGIEFARQPHVGRDRRPLIRDVLPRHENGHAVRKWHAHLDRAEWTEPVRAECLGHPHAGGPRDDRMIGDREDGRAEVEQVPPHTSEYGAQLGADC
jgi:hypothetical protein